jgi:hypothetical protein
MANRTEQNHDSTKIVVGKIIPRPPIENDIQDWNFWVVIKKGGVVFKFQTYKDSAWPARTQ